MEKVTKERAALALMRWVPGRRAALLRLSGMTVRRRDLLVSQGLTSWTYRRRRFCKAPRSPLGFPGYPQPQPHPPVLPDRCGNAERRSGIQTYSAPKARLFPMEKVTEVRALLALMRWVPIRRAASLHLSGMGGAEERLRSPRSFRLPPSLQGSTLQSMPCLFDNRSFCVGLRQGMDPMVKPWDDDKAGRCDQSKPRHPGPSSL